MGGSSDLGRRIRYLRERDRVTITKLSQLTHYDKERLREIELGRAEAKDWEIQTIAEVFGVKVDYFAAAKGTSEQGCAPDPAGEPAPAADPKPAPAAPRPAPAPAAQKPARAAPPGAPAHARKKPAGGGDLDFADCAFFKDDAPVASPPDREDDSDPPTQPQPLAADLFEESSEAIVSPAAPGKASPTKPAPSGAVRVAPSLAPRAAGSVQAPPAPKAVAPAAPPRAPSPPRPQPAKEAPSPPARAAAPPAARPPAEEDLGSPRALQDLSPSDSLDARAAMIENLVYTKALVAVLIQRGVFSAEDFTRALKRVRGG